ncbi:hypothetical protein LZ554_004416 [Drepanopeziza brunnea f. sp. 'monogermtubi']|nr:hypothetical protein LZ554_004416 [Drepanopeziza brunnea f. sp. 'monogermtubi']
MPAFDKANITDHLRQLERAFKDYDITADSEKKQHTLPTLVREEYKAHDLARWKGSIGFLNDLSTKWIEKEGASKAELMQFTRRFNLTGLKCLSNGDITNKQLKWKFIGCLPSSMQNRTQKHVKSGEDHAQSYEEVYKLVNEYLKQEQVTAKRITEYGYAELFALNLY